MSAITVGLIVLTLTGSVAPGAAPAADSVPGRAHAGQAAQDPDGLTPLMRGAARGDLAQVNALLAKGADPNAITPEQRVTALMCAAYFGRVEVIKALLAKGAKLEQKDAQGAAAVD